MLDLPRRFRATHPTSGLPGFAAVDIFGRPGELVRVTFACTVERISGRRCSSGGRPGGSYGLSVYLRDASGARYYATHLADVRVAPGETLTPSTVIGSLCNSAVSGKPRTTHVHWGRRPG